jgi:hypothetical protein
MRAISFNAIFFSPFDVIAEFTILMIYNASLLVDKTRKFLVKILYSILKRIKIRNQGKLAKLFGKFLILWKLKRWYSWSVIARVIGLPERYSLTVWPSRSIRKSENRMHCVYVHGKIYTMMLMDMFCSWKSNLQQRNSRCIILCNYCVTVSLLRDF